MSLRKILSVLMAHADERETARDISLLAKTSIVHRRNPAGFLTDVQKMADRSASESATWIDAAAIRNKTSGPFDALDLPCYLEIARKAGVAFVPGQEIARLTQEEFSAVSGEINLTHPRSTRVLKKLSRLFAPFAPAESPADVEVDIELVIEKLTVGLDDLPPNTMVRSARCGGSNLKAWAGAGIDGPEAPEVRFNSNVAVGPGWIRIGNRRRIETTDRRTVEAIAQGPETDVLFLARPWVRASRWNVGEDPHRHGTPFAGKGAWPCEWRVFIEASKVKGVSAYYPWAPNEATPIDARMALEARDLAQKMLDYMVDQALIPRFLDIELIRGGALDDQLASFARDQISCTLDFIETEIGMLFLEGGPPHTPFGGGHSCGFSGSTGAPTFGNPMDTSGVAFKLLDGVILADPATWIAGLNANRSGRLLNFEETQILAETYDCQTTPEQSESRTLSPRTNV